MHNVYVVRTPLQLLTAYILTYQLPKADNDLVLINPRGNKLWHSGFCQKSIATNTTIWQQITLFEHRIARRSELFKIPAKLQALKTRLNNLGKVDQVFLGSDREFDNQLLVELTGNTTYARIEDGVWSYSSPELPAATRAKTFFWSQIVRMLAGLHSDMKYNYRGGGYGKAAHADYLFKPELLQRYSPSAVKIERSVVHQAMNDLTKDIPPVEGLDGKRAIIFLGGTFVDKKLLSPNQEADILKLIYSTCQNHSVDMIYKPHPFEKRDKLSAYLSAMPNMKIINISDPIEVIYYKYANILAVISYSSSGLLYADIFARQDIKAIALFKLFAIEENAQLLENIMGGANIMLPRTLEEFSIALKTSLA